MLVIHTLITMQKLNCQHHDA